MKLLKFLCISVLLVSFIVACGGSSGSTAQVDGDETGDLTTVSGIAAAGAPIIGFVTLIDANGNSPADSPQEIGDDGSFEFDVTGLTAPFVLQAVGTVGETYYDLLSISKSNANANVNPLTNTIVKSLTNGSGNSDIMNNAALFAEISDDDINEVLEDVVGAFSVLIGEDTDPLFGEYVADHSGLDGIFDVVDVNVDENTGTVTIVGKLDSAELYSANINDIGAGEAISSDEAEAIFSARSAVNEIKDMLEDYIEVFNLESSVAADFSPYVADDFGMYFGKDRDEYIDYLLDRSEVLSDDKDITSITHLTILSENESVYKISYVLLYNDRSKNFKTEWVTKEGDSWKFTGNGKRVLIPIFRYNIYNLETVTGTKTESGLLFFEAVPGDGIAYGKITGEGLPAEGLIVVYDDSLEMLVIEDSQRNSELVEKYLYVFSDNDIDDIGFNEEYTMKFYDSDDNLVETQTRKLSAPPIAVSDIDSDNFPEIKDDTFVIDDIYDGEGITIDYSMPTKIIPLWGWVKAVLVLNNASDIKITYPRLSDRSATIAYDDYDNVVKIRALVGIKDQYGRGFVSMKDYTE